MAERPKKGEPAPPFFALQMEAEAKKAEPMITDGQGKFLLALRHRYRIQLGIGDVGRGYA